MKSPVADIASVKSPPVNPDELTGLPVLRTWRSVYIFVFGSFILWVLLLLVLTMSFS